MTRRSRSWALTLSVLLSALAATAHAQSADAPWRLQIAAGGGVGTRALDLPRDRVVYQTRTGAFPAIDVGLALDHAWPAFRLGLHARYQTSIGLRITERHTGGSERTQNLRSHRLELALSPSLPLDHDGSWRVSAWVGYGVCDLRPEVHLETPGYGLGGPFLRVELQLPVGTPRLRARIGPEVQWIVHVGKELAHEGFAATGFALGGVAALELALGAGWTVDVSLSELHAWLGSAQAESLRDASRFVTARLAGVL